MKRGTHSCDNQVKIDNAKRIKNECQLNNFLLKLTYTTIAKFTIDNRLNARVEFYLKTHRENCFSLLYIFAIELIEATIAR